MKLIHQSLQFLNLNPPEINSSASCLEQLAWGIENWDVQAVPKLANIPENLLEIE